MTLSRSQWGKRDSLGRDESAAGVSERPERPWALYLFETAARARVDAPAANRRTTAEKSCHVP